MCDDLCSNFYVTAILYGRRNRGGTRAGPGPPPYLAMDEQNRPGLQQESFLQ